MYGDVIGGVFQNPLSLHSISEKSPKWYMVNDKMVNEFMYLKYIRHKRPWGQLQRGTLYAVHFQPNEKGGYNETLTSISDVYEMTPGELLPQTLIYPVGVRMIDGRMRLVFGVHFRQSMLHLISREARERFFTELRYALYRHEEVRIEVTEA